MLGIGWIVSFHKRVTLLYRLPCGTIQPIFFMPDVNGRWEHLKSTVIKAAELTLGRKTREKV